MGDAVFKGMKEHWESDEFKLKSEQNKKNRDSNVGASLYTYGCIPHRLIYKRMKESTGKDPSISEFYFHTHRKKSDQSWVNEKAEDAYVSIYQLYCSIYTAGAIFFISVVCASNPLSSLLRVTTSNLIMWSFLFSLVELHMKFLCICSSLYFYSLVMLVSLNIFEFYVHKLHRLSKDT